MKGFQPMNLTDDYYNNWMEKHENPVTINETVQDPCGGIGSFILEGTNKGNITSPNYPSNYPTNTECSWHIKVDFGMAIKLKIHHDRRAVHEDWDVWYVNLHVSENTFCRNKRGYYI